MIGTAIGPGVYKLLRERGMSCELTDDFDYIRAGLVDSLGLLGFVLDLERTFEVELTDDEVASLEFRTFGGLCNLIERKLK